MWCYLAFLEKNKKTLNIIIDLWIIYLSAPECQIEGQMPSKWRIVRNKTPWKEGTLERRQWTESSEVLCSREQWDLVQDGGIWKIQNFYRTAFSWIFMELACSDIKVHFLTTVQCLQGISEHEVPESTWSLAQKQESLWKGENGWTWTEVVWFLGKLGFGTWSSVSSICSIFPIFLPVLRGKALEQIWQVAVNLAGCPVTSAHKCTCWESRNSKDTLLKQNWKPECPCRIGSWQNKENPLWLINLWII